MSRRAARRQHRALQVLLSACVAALLTFAVLTLWSWHQLTRKRVIPLEPLADVSVLSPELGASLYERYHCADCHGAQGEGAVILDEPMIGRIVAPRLEGTGSLALRYRDDRQLARAIRHGVDPDGRALRMMPPARNLDETELAALVLHLRNLEPAPATGYQLPASSVAPLGHLLNALGLLPLNATAQELQP